ncbi:MAG TPA: hypothetical protein VGT41_06135 [Candidatus Babeliales bacterium]|nr:hypothetical protein [Candidatus Babeliales bacterium]
MNVKMQINKAFFSLAMISLNIGLSTPSVVHAGVINETSSMLGKLVKDVVAGAKHAGVTTKRGCIWTKRTATVAAPYIITGAVAGSAALVSGYVLLAALRLIKNGTLVAAHELANVFVCGYEQTQQYKSVLEWQKDDLHSLYRRHMPGERDLLKDLKAYWHLHGPKSGTLSFHDHMRTSIRLDLADLEAMFQEMKKLSNKWDLLNLFSTKSLFEDAVEAAKRVSGHYYDPIFKFENLTGPEYAAMSRAFYMHVLAPTKTIPSIVVPLWWNYVSEICLMWTIQKKIYQLQAMERVISNDSSQPVAQHAHITHHLG